MTERHEPNDFVTTQEAAAILRVSPRTVDRYAKRGLLTRYQTAGGLPRYRVDDVERLQHPQPVAEATRTAP